RTTSYTYDSRDRLATVAVNGSARTAYTYDANGNRLSRDTEAGTYDAQDRVLTYGGATFGWSPNGYWMSRTKAGQTTYTYDLDGPLTAVTTPDGRNIQYVVDPTGQRVGKKVNGSLQAGWLWDGDFLIAELDANGALSKHFVYAENTVVPSFYLAGTNAYRILSDDRGSVRFVVDIQTGTVVQTLDYDEFGRVLADSAPGLQPFGFAGGQYDPDTGLVRFGSRDYSAETGTWTSRDPIGFSDGQLNLFTYAGGDPINHVDPLGTGPFGFLNRNRQRAIDAAFDTSPGNNERFANALDRYNKSVNATVVTAQVLVTTGDAVNRVAWSLAGARAASSSFGSTSANFSSRSSLSSSGRAPIGRIMAPRAASGGPGLPGGPAPGAPLPEPVPPPPPAPTPTPPTPAPPAFPLQDTIMGWL
ncbi:MAG TPA: RHS repeat-associated core domain-containing protein, partial [Verrucomicrobiae bacterium]|nr:RHS repeat-associated core domain-containing protein [Verrucomicrobiae bacterium]